MPSSLGKTLFFVLFFFFGFLSGFLLNQKFREELVLAQKSEYIQLNEYVATLSVQPQSKKEIKESVKEIWSEESEFLEDDVEYLIETLFFQNDTSNYFTFKSVVTTDKHGSYKVLAKADVVDENKKVLDSLFIRSGKIIVNKERKYIYYRTGVYFDPSLSINCDLIFSDVIHFYPAIGFSLFEYRTKEGPLLNLAEFQFGMISLDDYTIMMSPVSINIGRFLPIIKNTYIKPLIGIRKTNFAYGIGLGINF